MRCLINGQEVPHDNLARRGPMNFGQAFPEPARALRYQIAVEKEEFINCIREYYEQAALEEKADAPFHASGKSPVLDRWQELEYPPLESLFDREPSVLEDLIKESFELEVLDRMLPGPQSGLPRFLVNSIDGVNVANGRIIIEGNAYLHPKLMQAS